MIFWDRTGIVLISKRLEDGKFRWPRIEAGVMRLSPAQLTTLFEGLDWTRVHVRRVRAHHRRKCCDPLVLTRDIGDHKWVGNMIRSISPWMPLCRKI